MPSGFLRNSVVVDRSDDYVVLQHSFWQLELPKDWVTSTPGLWEFFDRQMPAQNLASNVNPELHGLLQLLNEQGCLSFPDHQDSYSLEDVKELFIHLSAQWYGQYYSHPIWQRLRDGSLAINSLVAWLIHNYHVSRSAGMSDARCAVRLTKPELRQRFAQNALEEYSHCDEFYFVNHPRLHVSDAEVKNYIPLPASLAFDHQMLRMAEDDWLGHVLVSFFQESTVRFLEDCKGFYRLVEHNYQIEGFFASWQQHIELDLEYGHASNFARILSAAESVSKVDLLRSLRNARFTFHFLIEALDEILAEETWGSRIFLRSPIRNALLDLNDTAILAPYARTASLPRRLEAEQATQLYDELRAIGLTTPSSRNSSSRRQALVADKEFMLSDVTLSIYKALSYADEHDLVILYGRLAQEATLKLRDFRDDGFSRSPLPRSYCARALANFVNEQATKPQLFAFLLLHLAELDPTCVPVTDEGKMIIRKYLSSFSTSSITNSLYSTRLLQLNEFYTLACSDSNDIKEMDFFFD